MRRTLLIGSAALGVIVLVVLVVSIFVLSNLDSIIQTAVEKEGSKVTRVKVTLGDVDISPTSGRGALRNLKIANPEGYKTDSAFDLGEVAVDIDVSTITDDVIVVNAITVTRPQITYEIGGAAGNNIDAIRRNVNEYLGTKGKKTTGTAPKAAKDEGPKLVIKNLYVRDGKIRVSATALADKKLSSSLPDLHLKDIGKDSGGSSPGEVVQKIITAVGESASKAVASLDLKGMIGAGGKAVEGVTKDIIGPGGAVQTGTESLGKGIEKLFGK